MMTQPRLLRRHAIRLWHGNRRNAREWLRAVGVVRSTEGGWILDGGASWRVRGSM